MNSVNSIIFSIGSKFSSDGMNQAVGAVKRLSQTVTRSAGFISAMATSMGGLDAACVRSMNAVAGFLNVLASGDPIMIAGSASMLALSKIVDHFNEKIKAVTANAAALKSSCDAAFNKTMTSFLSDAVKQAGSLVTEFDKVTNSANAFAAALQGVKDAGDRGTILDLQVGKLNAMIKAQADGSEGLVAAEYDLRIAKEKARQSTEGATADFERAQSAAMANEERTRKLEEARALVIEKRTDLEGQLSAVDGEPKQKMQAAIDKLAEEEEKYTGQISASIDKQTLLDAAVAAAKQNQINAQKQGTLDVTAADNLVEREKARQKTEQVANLEEQLADATKNLAESRVSVKTAEAEYKSALEKYNDNINANLLNDHMMEQTEKRKGKSEATWVNGNRKGDAEQAKADQAKAAEVAVDKGIASGEIRNMADLQRAERAAARANRDYNSSRAANQERRDAEEYDRLSNMSEKRMSQWQKDRLAKLEKLRGAKDKDRNDLNAAESNMKAARGVEYEMAGDVAAIKAKLEDLGLQ